MSKSMNAQTQFMLDQMCAGVGGVVAAIVYCETADRTSPESWKAKTAGIVSGAVVMGGLMWLHRKIAE